MKTPLPSIPTIAVRPWTDIVVHHSATVDGRTHDWEAIRRYHMSYRIDGTSVTVEEFERRLLAKQGKRFERPWRDIGYHYGIERVGDEFQYQLGRSLNMIGAHCVGMNAVAIGICCVGNYDLGPPPDEMADMLVDLLERLCTPQPVGIGIPVDHIWRHSDYAPKTCPGLKFDLETIRSKVRERLDEKA
jgi:N-acetylmuramoyl-L-alanine amidase